MRYSCIFTLFLLHAAGHAQVKVDRPIHLVGPDPADRQINGLHSDVSGDEALNAMIEMNNAHRYPGIVTGPAIVMDLPAVSVLQPGTQILVQLQSSDQGPMTVTLNGQGPYEVIRRPGVPLHGDEISAGTMISLIFDGIAFQMIHGNSHSLKNCPAGMVAVNDQFCMQPEKSSEAVEFWTAVENCNSIGARLCTWGEFYSACAIGTELGIVGAGGHEWTNQTANEDASVRIVGNLSCFQGGTSLPTIPRFYRCCFSR